MTTSPDPERWAGAVVVVICVLVAVPVWLVELAGAAAVTGPFWLWNVGYVAYLAALILQWMVPDSGALVTSRRLFGLQVAAGAAVVLLSPRSGGLTAILLVFTAATAGYYLSTRMTLVLIAANTGVVAVATWGAASGPGGPIGLATEVGLVAMIYTLLQLATAYMTWSQQLEARALNQLAVAHTELRTASALLAESSQASERLRIARELHDLLGHQLTALALELEIASHKSVPPGSEHVARARTLAKDLLRDVRGAVGELRSQPPQLRAALETVVADLPRPRVHLHVDDTIELDEAHTTTLVRCVQEVLTNAIRHAEAQNLWIDVHASPAGSIAVSARDDGRGAPLLKLGHGLTGLRERFEQLGGEVAFDSHDGFRVQAELPPSRVSTA